MRYIFILIIFFTANVLPGQDGNSQKKYKAKTGNTLRLAVDSVNYLLSTLTHRPHQNKLKVKANGQAKLSVGNDTHFAFNFRELKNSSYATGNQVNGIELQFYTPGTRAEHDWINFYKEDKIVAFIKLSPTPRGVLTQLHNLLITISTLSKQNNIKK